MANRTVSNQRAHGEAVLGRLEAESLPAALKAPAKEFKGVQREVESASRATEEARGVRDGALEELAMADAALDGYVDSLADALVGAGMGTRRSPLASFTRRSVSELVGLAYATEAKEVRALCAAIRKRKPASSVVKVVAQCEKQVGVVERSIAALAKPQASYAKALAKRDALFPEWTRKLARLKRHAAVAWEDEPAMLSAIFAPPGTISAPKAKRRKPAPAVVNGGPPGVSASEASEGSG